MGLGTVVLSQLAAGLFGLGHRLALGEGSGLTLAGASRLVELASQALVLGLQVVDPSLQGLTVGTSQRFHVEIIRGSGSRSGPREGWRQDRSELQALIKYLWRSAVGNRMAETINCGPTAHRLVRKVVRPPPYRRDDCRWEPTPTSQVGDGTSLR